MAVPAPTPSAPVVPLSVLDLSQIPSGSTSTQALRSTVDLARTAEALGYHRFWTAEHHNMGAIATSAPEVVIATVAAATSTIRVGSGGVMLPNHSPLKVAELFRLLEALHPGRIDLGLGRAPGTDGHTAIALRRSREALFADDFDEQFEELLGYVDGFPPGHPFESVTAQPSDVPLPPVWILGSSDHGSRAAAQLGTGYAYAGHFGNADPVAVLRHYRENFQPSARLAEPHAVLAVGVMVAETTERAQELLRSQELAMVRLRQGRAGMFPSPEEAAAHPWSLLDRRIAAEVSSHVVAGTPDVVAGRLRTLVQDTGADELMVVSQVHDPAERRHAYALLADAWGLAGPAGRAVPSSGRTARREEPATV